MSISGYPCYEVTKEGKVFNKKTLKYFSLKPQKSGYVRITLRNAVKSKTFYVHRLVALCFIPNPLNLPEVNHKDGNKSNNNDWNLEWSTKSNNILHAYSNNLIGRGSYNAQSILDENSVLEIIKKYKPRVYTRAMLAKEYGVSVGCIDHIFEGRSWRHVRKYP